MIRVSVESPYLCTELWLEILALREVIHSSQVGAVGQCLCEEFSP